MHLIVYGVLLVSKKNEITLRDILIKENKDKHIHQEIIRDVRIKVF